MASASSSSGSSHESCEPVASPPLSILSPPELIVSVVIPGESRDVSVQGSRIHPTSRAMGRGSGTFISLLGQKDVDSLVEKYEIDLSLFEVRVPCSGERASSPREGEIAIYQDALLGGLRIPFSYFAKAILEEYNLCPSQLTPNSWRLLNSFVVVFKNYGVNPTVHWFRMLFSLCLESNADWYYFSARSGRKFLGKVPSSIKRWKSKFFFVKSKSEWDVRTKWEVPRTDIACEEMTQEEEVLLKSMTGLSKVYMDDFLTKENLVKCRLIIAAGNPMEDEDLSYVKGLLAYFEGEVHPPLPRGRKKKEVASSKVADTSKEEKRKRKEVDSSKKGDPLRGGGKRGGPLGQTEGGGLSLKGAATQRKELPSEDIPFRDARSVKDVLMAMRPEQPSAKLRRAGREEATYQLFRSAMLDDSSSLKEELKSAQEERGKACWDLKLKVAELAAIQAELEELKGERDTLKEDLAFRQKTPKSDSE
ncbi:hypothetical protein J5N97_022372 [Dioscorea zingiberensis]|uniref:Transposase (putative) gypsy type domain-containing protein n=1 Tax=Dioscorea zingiberensis TaxID=325984 RepID=A0A9D5HAT8_9LILI|nr:hypothetical protein J5N97_022372 [Dioscorea zingiberensis]